MKKLLQLFVMAGILSLPSLAYADQHGHDHIKAQHKTQDGAHNNDHGSHDHGSHSDQKALNKAAFRRLYASVQI